MNPTVFDRDELLLRVSNDHDLVVTLIDVFRKKAPELVQSLQEAGAGPSFEAAKCAAHTLRGMAANFSAPALLVAAKAAEQAAIAEQSAELRAACARVGQEWQILDQHLTVYTHESPAR